VYALTPEQLKGHLEEAYLKAGSRFRVENAMSLSFGNLKTKTGFKVKAIKTATVQVVQYLFAKHNGKVRL
jgi:hypothetical protein